MKNNIPFFPDMKMADVIHADYHLISVFDRMGIQFGFGNRTIEEVCKDHNINIWFFLEIINSYHEPNYLVKNSLGSYSISLIVNYLKVTHNFYREEKIPQIQSYIEELEDRATEDNLGNIKLLNNFFKEYIVELNSHLDFEDQNIFPYIIELENSFSSGLLPEELLLIMKNTPTDGNERAHENMELKLSDLKNLIIKFLPPTTCNKLCQRLLTELYRLEDDLRIHTLLEDKVLIPKAKQLELAILGKREYNHG